MLMYFMLTGNHPFGRSDYECQANVLRGRPTLKSLNSEIDDLVHHLITLEPEYRLPAVRAIR